MAGKTWNDLWTHYEARRVRGKRSAKETVRLFETHVAPSLGPKLVAKTNFQTIEKLHGDLEETPYQANRVLSLLRPMYKYAAALEWIEPGKNPARDVRMFPERRRKRHMKTGEAPKIAQAILNKEPYCPDACLFLWLLIFTGARPAEIKAAKWGELHGNRIVQWRHKTSDKTGTERVIVLPPAAMEKLKLIPKGNPWSRIIRISNPEYVWRTIRKDAGCPDLRVYDLRHTFATYALEHGYTLEQIGESLAHTNVQTTKIYAEMTTRSRQRIALDVSMSILQDMEITDEAADALT